MAPQSDPEPGPHPSFAKALFQGHIAEDLVFPYPSLGEDADRVPALCRALHDVTSSYDPKAAEEERWVGDDTLAALGDAGLLGLYVSPDHGGQGLSQTGYCRVMEEVGRIDGTLAVVLGVHQSIGMKGIHLYGTDEQRERFLPDLASGRKLAAFALTEPEAGSDAYHLQTQAEQRQDGSWVLNGEKRYIGNGSKDVVVTFARVVADGEEQGHVALIVERGMEGFEVGDRYDTMGLRANDLRKLYFNDVVVPAANVLGDGTDGFSIAMSVLNNGRMSLGTSAVGLFKAMLELSIDHTTTRRQFGRPLADFELVQEKLSWMVSYLYGLESMAYLTTGLVDRGVPDYSLESAMAKIAGTETMWYAANRAFQLRGGEAYMRTDPYEKLLRDIRIFPVFEGANDVMRAYVALSGLKDLGAELEGLNQLDLSDPIGSIGLLGEYVAGRLSRRVRPDEVTLAHPALDELAAPLTQQTQRLRATAEKLLRTHGAETRDRQWHQKRLCHAAMDIYAQVATLSRTTALFEAQGAEISGEERYLTETFCTRAARRVHGALDQVEHNDDDRMHSIAQSAIRRGGYAHSLY